MVTFLDRPKRRFASKNNSLNYDALLVTKNKSATKNKLESGTKSGDTLWSFGLIAVNKKMMAIRRNCM